MKYIKTFERMYKDNDGQSKQSLTKKTVDYNKIYTIIFSTGSYVGKISDNPRDFGCIMDGYDLVTGVKFFSLIKYANWQRVREATTEEIEKYNIFMVSNKFNL
jgi:hypothetical protein